ncbi:hypothetical protein ASF34_15030 [Methylobacterium sp. Leaf106]|nr:hypothetical protein ASF34_15030 [Methylobacterium sp. Leaf106]
MSTTDHPARSGAMPGIAGVAGQGSRAFRAVLRRTSRVGLVFYTLALGAGLGLATADYATRGGYPFGGVSVGSWIAWPRTGSLGADPYARAVNARRGEIPLAVGEGLLLTASQDDEGRALNAACTYRIAGATPPARAWTITVAGRGKRDPERTVLREGFTSTEVLRDVDGRFSIVLASDVQPGNWLPMPRAAGPVRLALRLYDTPVAASAGTVERSAVPTISRTECAE